MVAVSHRDADTFIRNSAANSDLFLVFGTDAGLVSERSRAILRSIGIDPRNPDESIRIDGDEIAGNPGRLMDEVHAIGLFSSKRAILVRAGSRQITSAIEAILESPAPDCKVIIQAGELRRDSQLRMLATRSQNSAAIECYPDQSADILRLIDSECRAAGLQIEPAARELLGELLGDDRMSTRAEISKLMTYAHGQTKITEADVMAIVTDASAFITADIVLAAFSGDLKFIGDTSAQLYSTPSEAQALLASALRHAQLLLQIHFEIESSLGKDSAIEKLAGRSFFGPRKARLSQQVSLWQTDSLLGAARDINLATLESRQESALTAPIIMHALLQIARRANYRARQR